MKKLKNFLEKKIIFRCDAAENPKVGTGHLYRCIIIANFLKKKFKLKKNDIIFYCKLDKEYKKSNQILHNSKFKIKKIDYSIKENSIDEASILSEEKGKLLIIDRISKTNLNFFKKIKNSYEKKIILEDQSIFRKKFDLSINSLVIPKTKLFKTDNLGFKHLILKSFNFATKGKERKKNIFLSFGGYDHNRLCNLTIKSLNNLNKNLNLLVPQSYFLKKSILKNNLKIIYYKKNQYLKYFNECNIAIVSGGLTLYDGVVFKKKIICIPQYYHQLINAKKIQEIYPLFILNHSDKNFNIKIKKIINELYENKLSNIDKKIKNSKILTKNNYKSTLKKISNLYES